MKREFLKNLGLEDDVIDQIMQEHGKGITKAKADYDDVKEQLDTAQTTIADLKKNNADNEKLQATITEHEATIEKLQKESTQKDFNYKLEDALKSSKAKNLKALKALLDMDKVKLEGDKIAGLEDQLKALKETDAYLFDEAEAQPNLGGAKPVNKEKQPTGKKYTVAELMKMKNDDPDFDITPYL